MTRPPSDSAFRLGTVLLAAGSSSRMGRSKLLLPWGETTILGHLVGQWQRLQAFQLAVVCAPADRRLQEELDRIGVGLSQRIYNSAPERGMLSSVQSAARWPEWHASLTHWAVVLGDQPHLRLETLRALLDFSAANPESICQPGRHGHGRHPVLLPRTAWVALAGAATPDLKAFLRSQPLPVLLLETDDAGFDLDLDTPADYEHARRMHFS